MLHYRWPGNVRELKSSIESTALRSMLEGGDKIRSAHLTPLLMSQDLPSKGSKIDIFRKVAETELTMVEEALIRSGGKKTEAWKLLNYTNRFVMRRRVKRILENYPDLINNFPEVKKNYSYDEKNTHCR
jgi:transcriptional regulator with PAS, ATPase and Fis domain